MGTVKAENVPLYANAVRDSWHCDHHGGFHPNSVKQYRRQNFTVCEAGALLDYVGKRICDRQARHADR